MLAQLNRDASLILLTEVTSADVLGEILVRFIPENWTGHWRCGTYRFGGPAYETFASRCIASASESKLNYTYSYKSNQYWLPSNSQGVYSFEHEAQTQNCHKQFHDLLRTHEMVAGLAIWVLGHCALYTLPFKCADSITFVCFLNRLQLIMCNQISLLKSYLTKTIVQWNILAIVSTSYASPIFG